MTEEPEWTPITIIRSEDGAPKDGGIELVRQLSVTPDAEWVHDFEMIGPNKHGGSGAFTFSSSTPSLVGDTIRWKVPQRDAPYGSNAIANQVQSTNDRYSSRTDRRIDLT